MRQVERALRNEAPDWADKVAVALEELERGDHVHGARRFLEMHGGMGSLNDLYLGARFAEIDQRAWSLANAIVRKADRVR